MAKKKTSIALPEDYFEWLNDNNIRLTSFVENAIKKEMEKQEKIAKLLEEQGEE